MAPPTTLVLVCSIVLVTACDRTDAEVQAAVDVKLASHADSGTLILDVTVAHGIATLFGAVQTPDQQRRVVAIARAVDGVKDVIDQMYVDDMLLAEAVKRALTSDPLIGTIPIAVNAHRGTVALISDQTNRDDRIRAVEVASRVEGVKSVEDLMR